MPKTWPPVLYHYTSSSALLSILHSRSIWLSSRWHLNDFNEGEVFGKHVLSYASANGTDSATAHAVAERLAGLECYVSCFSSERDMLSQWRGYATDGTGVCVGFKSKTLVNVISGSPTALLKKVIYADDHSQLDDETQGLIAALLKSTGEPREAFVQSVAKVKWAIKNKTFREEDEYRLILTPDPKTPSVSFDSGAKAVRGYRASDKDVREYYDFSFASVSPNELLHEIVLGPKNGSNDDVIRRLLDDGGFDQVTIDRSTASYR